MHVFARKVENFVAELDAAVETHHDWTRNLLRCAVSRTPPGDDVLASDAHCRCRFGRWIEGHREDLGRIDQAATARMFDEHRRMHAAVRRLCLAIIADGKGEAHDLEDFEASQRDLLAELARFKTTLLEQCARLDSLTGLPLRHGLEEVFDHFRSATRRLGKKTAVMMIDVDHFKRVNDTYGHAVGDLALKHIAEILSSRARADEPVFRFGGEEFLQLVRIDAAAEAEAVADRLLQALRSHPMTLPGGEPLELRVSSGLTLVSPDDDLEQAIARADQALYAAKAAGRDRWCWAEARRVQPDRTARSIPGIMPDSASA